MDKWPSDRLILALQLLVALPAHPTMTMQDLVQELECPKTCFYRLVRDLRRAGFTIETSCLPNGQTAYFLTRVDRLLLDRILRVNRAA